MAKKLQHFLLVFDHEAGRLLKVKDFGPDGKNAVAAYAAKEQELADNRFVEIVLIGSDSWETVRLTHANYFDDSVAVSKYLVGT